MRTFVLFNDTVCEVMNLAGEKCLVRDSEGKVFEVYPFELSDIPLSRELLEHLGFRVDRMNYKIKWECYELTKINRVYLTPTLCLEEKELTPPIGYVVTEDGERRFSIFVRDYIDNRIGTCWVNDLNEFLYLCDRSGCHVDADIRRLDVFMLRHQVD